MLRILFFDFFPLKTLFYPPIISTNVLFTCLYRILRFSLLINDIQSKFPFKSDQKIQSRLKVYGMFSSGEKKDWKKYLFSTYPKKLMDLDHLLLFENSRKKINIFRIGFQEIKGKKIGLPKNCRKKIEKNNVLGGASDTPPPIILVGAPPQTCIILNFYLKNLCMVLMEF